MPDSEREKFNPLSLDIASSEYLELLRKAGHNDLQYDIHKRRRMYFSPEVILTCSTYYECPLSEAYNPSLEPISLWPTAQDLGQVWDTYT